MVDVTALWLPILVAAVLVFFASSISHMVLPFHRADYGRAPSEKQLQESLRSFNIPAGDFMVPCPGTPAEMKAPEFQEMFTKGPIVFMTVQPTGSMAMGGKLGCWFIFCVFVGIFAGYVAGITLPPGADYRVVFRVTGTVAFMAYGFALWEGVIWYNRSAMTALRSSIDSLVFGLLTAGAFGWLWPPA